MKTKISISIGDLEAIIEEAKMLKKIDSSRSDTLEFELLEECDTHLGSDKVRVWVKSNYSECVGDIIYSRKNTKN